MAVPTARAIFRFIYNALYTFFYVLLVALLIITPSDVIYRAWVNGQLYNIWIVAAGYFITLLVVAFVYGTRLYINKTALAAIPKQWIPIEREDVHPTVYELIQYGLDRSAAIAYDARPRVKNLRDQAPPAGGNAEEANKAANGNGEGRQEKRLSGLLRLRRQSTAEKEPGVILPPHNAVWGAIEHPGWGSPTSPDLADLQYSTVYLELPTLIEAKALTLVPPAPDADETADPPLLDPEAIALLQRPASMSLREYVTHLSELGVLPPAASGTTGEFLALYEAARFSGRTLLDADFRRLTRLFAEVLRSMGPPPDDSVFDEGSSSSGRSSYAASFLRSQASNPSLRSKPSRSTFHSSREGTDETEGVETPRRQRSRSPEADSVDGWAFRTAPTTPKSGSSGRVSSSARSVVSSVPSVESFAQTRAPYPVSQPSSASLRSGSSAASGSVVRFAG